MTERLASVDGPDVAVQPPPSPGGESGEPIAIPRREPMVRLELDGVELVLLGTAHVSQASVGLVREVIAAERPDRVCLELDPQRLEALQSRGRWAELDLRQVIRKRQLSNLLLSLLLTSWQRRLGAALGVEPGAELLAGAEEADRLGIPVELVDRDVRITVRRAAAAMGFWGRIKLLSELLVSLLDPGEASAEEIEKLKDGDVLSSLLAELGERHPGLQRVLIAERDQWLATRILEVCAAQGSGRVVAVVGAGHLAGMQSEIASRSRADLERLGSSPPPGKAARIVGWSIPVLVGGSLAWIASTRGADAFAEHALFWILANGIPAAIGALIALAHPLTILAAFVAAPITSLSPLIGAGYVTAFVEAWLRPPRVRELVAVADDAGTPRAWWSNRVLRILLAFILPSLGSVIGTFVGGADLLAGLR